MNHFDHTFFFYTDGYLLYFTGSEFVEDAPLEVAARLVFRTKKEQREKERAEERERKDKELNERIAAEAMKTPEQLEQEEEEEKQRQRKARRVKIAEMTKQ